MTHQEFSTWVERLGKAWVARDPDMAAGLCAENVLYYEDPFEEPLEGRAAVQEIWEEVPKIQKDIRFTHDVTAVNGQMGIAHWSASYAKISSGKRVALDGVFVVTLDEKGLCSEFRMWWNSKAQ